MVFTDSAAWKATYELLGYVTMQVMNARFFFQQSYPFISYSLHHKSLLCLI